MEENLAQKPESWRDFWGGRTPYHELSLKDTYGERPYVLKYVPRNGKVIEAGSGLGRVSFYLEKIGIDIIGVDFSKKDLCQCRSFSRKNNFEPKRFIHGDILDLPFEDNSCSGYLSFGVVEHFIEGPQKPLKEAFRVLRSGGILILTTPNRFAIHRLYGNIKNELKFSLKKLFYFLKGEKISRPKEDFWQYWYSKEQLVDFTEKQGFKTVISENFGLKSALDWLIKSPEFRIFELAKPLLMRMANVLDNTFLRSFSANSIVVSYKPGENLHCFLSGESSATLDSNIPLSPVLMKKLNSKILDSYANNQRPYFRVNNNITEFSTKITDNSGSCHYCKKSFLDNDLIDLSFSIPICSNCIKDPLINIEVSNLNLVEKWVPWK